MKNLPFELVEDILYYIPMHHLKSVDTRVSHIFRVAAKNIIKKRLRGCLHLLNNLTTFSSGTLPSFIDLQDLVPRSSTIAQTPHPFRTWLLCNLEYPSDSNVISAIEIELSGCDEERAQLIFVPTGQATFGMWVDNVGFFPITATYQLPSISWLPKIKPLFRIWTHIDEKVFPEAHLILSQPNCTAQLPKNKSHVKRDLGTFDLALSDEFGVVAEMNYTIESGANRNQEILHTHSNLPSSLSGENLLLMHLEQQESKISAVINHILINPQVFLVLPL